MFIFTCLRLGAEESARCYSFEREDPATSPQTQALQENWCYQRTTSGLFVFNGDSATIKPELSFLVRPDGTISHASKMAGRLTFHRVLAADFNPFGIPPNEPESEREWQTPRFKAQPQVPTEIPEGLITAPRSLISVGRVRAQAAFMPWRGPFWSFRERQLFQPLGAPLRKYDLFVTHDPDSELAVGWERRHHGLGHPRWGGHCNGWAASSILRSEPRQLRYDKATGLMFGIADQKGLLAVTHYCARTAFFGKRNRSSNADTSDIEPALFYKVLRYYIGVLKKPVAVDYRADAVVENHVISGYTMTATKLSKSEFHVVAKLDVHRYDKEVSNRTGMAPAYLRTYRFVLKADQDGQPVSGRWLSKNPDFLWVPLSVYACKSRHPDVSHAKVNAILSLPIPGRSQTFLK